MPTVGRVHNRIYVSCNPSSSPSLLSAGLSLPKPSCKPFHTGVPFILDVDSVGNATSFRRPPFPQYPPPPQAQRNSGTSIFTYLLQTRRSQHRCPAKAREEEALVLCVRTTIFASRVHRSPSSNAPVALSVARVAEAWNSTPTKWYPLPVGVGALLLAAMQYKKEHSKRDDLEVVADDNGNVVKTKRPWQVRLNFFVLSYLVSIVVQCGPWRLGLSHAIMQRLVPSQIRAFENGEIMAAVAPS